MADLRTRHRRTHPADVTADRLGDAAMKWHDRFDGYELDAIGTVVHALREIAEGSRATSGETDEA